MHQNSKNHSQYKVALLKTKFGALLLLSVLLGSSACSTIDLKQYQDNQPVLDFYHFFEGDTAGWGIVQDRRGNLTRQFTVQISGTVSNANVLTLVETFDWSDGKKETRTWTITKQNNHEFKGTATDVVGEGAGILYGNVMNWSYQLLLPVDGSQWKIDFKDWMFLVDEGLLLNKAVMSKFGLKVGEVTIIFQKK